MTGFRSARLALVWAAAGATGARAQVPEVPVTAVAEFAAVRAGSQFRVAVRLQVPATWHIGWINPGAGGLATSVVWRTPAGVTLREVEFPYPETDDAGGEISHVYRGAVVLFSSFEATAGAAGTLRLAADLDWGLCKEQCVRQQRTVTVELPVRSATRGSDAWGAVALAQRALPVRLPADQIEVRASGDSVAVTIVGLANGPAAGSWATFFPSKAGLRSVVVQLRAGGQGVGFKLPASVADVGLSTHLAGVLVGAHPQGVPPATRPLALDAPVSK